MTSNFESQTEERRLREILERSINEIYVFRADDLRFTYINTSALSNLGYSREAAKQLTPLDLKPKLSEPEFRAMLQPLLDGTKKLQIFETLHRRKNGSTYPVEVHLQLTETGPDREFLAVIYDETNLHEARQETVRRYDRVAQSLLEVGRVLNGQGSLDSRITKICEVTSELLECDRCSVFIVENGYYQAKWNHGNPPDIAKRFPMFKVGLKDPLIRKAVESRSFVIVNDPIADSLMNTETARNARISGICVVPVQDLHGETLGFMTVEFNESPGTISTPMATIALGLADLVGRTIIADQLDIEKAKLAADLEHSRKVEALGRLAGGVAHDINNLLQVILGFTGFGRSEVSVDSPVLSSLEEIERAAERAAGLTGQLLAFARKQPIRPKLIELNSELESIVQMLRRLLPEDIEVVWQPGPGEYLLFVDPTQLNQIVTNLFTNARDSIESAGKIMLSTSEAELDARQPGGKPSDISPGRFVCLTVADDGCGISPEERERIFEPFYSLKGDDRGTGLGLATVLGTATQNGGFVTVESEPGSGSSFQVFLPLAEGVVPEDVPEVDVGALPNASYTILVVEDEEILLELVEHMLQRLGYNVLQADSPESAIDVANDFSGDIDLLLADVVLRSSNGRVLADRLLESRPNMKVLFMSGYTADIIAKHGVAEVGTNLLPKPFTQSKLSLAVQETLGISKDA